MKNIYVVIDGQAGSCGKGKVIGEMALNKKIDVAIANCMPNAGHTFVQNGKQRVFRSIPVSAVNCNTVLFMGAGTVINMAVLEQEYEENKDILEGREIIVHPGVPLIKQRHIEKEKELLKSGSTFKGGGACLAEKIMRSPKVEFFKEFKHIKADKNYHEKLIKYLKEGKKILLEGTQGCDLDINHSGHYPYVTSRQISVAQMCADSGISPIYLKEIVMVIRPFPIRISNQTELGSDIFSGYYGDSKELSWLQINTGADKGWYPTEISPSECDENTLNFSELTTVTKKERRVFDLSIEQLKKNVEINTPTSIYLNFFQQLGVQYSEKKGLYEEVWIEKNQREYINWLEDELKVPITKLGTGPDLTDFIDREGYTKKLILK